MREDRAHAAESDEGRDESHVVRDGKMSQGIIVGY